MWCVPLRLSDHPLAHEIGMSEHELSIFGKVMTDLNSLVVFAKVAEANSFSQAARRLKMPISTVSRRIAELEDQLGVRLLERSTRSLRLTELGAESLGKTRRYHVGGYADRSVESPDSDLHSGYARRPHCAVEIDLCSDTLVLRADQIRFIRCGPYGWRDQPARHQIWPLGERQVAVQSGRMVWRRHASSRVVVAALGPMGNAT